MRHRRTYDNVVQTTFDTPLIRLNRVGPGTATVLVKCEFFNPMASVKDRIGRSMIEDAEARGVLTKGTHIVEPTSGNTGIALAFVAAAKGYQLTLTMPETMSIERRALLRGLGANLVLTPGDKGMKGAIEEATRLLASTPNSWMPQQFENPANPMVHERTTGPELWEDTEGRIDVLVAGVGTGGTISGAGRYLKRLKPAVKCIAVEPVTSPVITQTRAGQPVVPGKHKIQGIGAGFVPKNLDLSVVDGVELASDDEAYDMARKLAKQEGLFVGVSSGAVVAAAVRLASQPQYAGKTLVAVAASFGERYLSTPLFQEHMK